MVTAPGLRPGVTAWRIGERSGTAIRCLVKRMLDGGVVEVQSSSFSKASMRLDAKDVFLDREACRREITRRAALHPVDLVLPPGVTRGPRNG